MFTNETTEKWSTTITSSSTTERRFRARRTSRTTRRRTRQHIRSGHTGICCRRTISSLMRTSHRPQICPPVIRWPSRRRVRPSSVRTSFRRLNSISPVLRMPWMLDDLELLVLCRLLAALSAMFKRILFYLRRARLCLIIMAIIRRKI